VVQAVCAHRQGVGTGIVGAGFVPVSDRSEISMTVEAPPGSNLEYTQLRAEAAARIARAHPEVLYTYTTVGSSVPGKAPSVDQALVYVRLRPKADRSISQEELGQVLRREMAGLGGAQVSVFTSGFGGALKSIQVQMKGTDARTLTTLAQRTPGGMPSTLPLGQVATITQGLGPAEIDHLDRETVVIVQANVSGRPLTQVTRDIQSRLASLKLPPGYEITWGGETRDQAEVFTRIFTALGVAVLLMYLILVVQFGSFLDPLAILVSLPLSLIGVVLALWITRDTLNIMSLIGVILLMGIVVKNAILLIDFALWARERGEGLREALIEAGRIRLRPIIMTTLALIAGMIPVAIGHGEGADFRAPLGRAVIGGTITSTLLTLLVIPTVYEILDNFRTWLALKLGRRPAHAHGGVQGPTTVPARSE
jgi:multidrug efflux pump subunit AcrB